MAVASRIQNRDGNFNIAEFLTGDLVENLGGVGAAGPGKIDLLAGVSGQSPQAVVRISDV